MSSEEVAELAQAIHNHADVLYESWKKGQDVFNMKKMEDTLELLADPGLTPRLEHLVSNFVRRDKAKRQLQHVGDNDQVQMRESSPSGGSPRKSLPKSILAVVQRFEPQQLSPPNHRDNGESPQLIHSPRERSPAGTGGEGFLRINVPGVGPVSKSLVWADSKSKHSSSERISDRSSPTPIPINIKTYLDSSNTTNAVNSSNGFAKSVVFPSSGKNTVRERRIPIERTDEVDVSPVSPNRIPQPAFPSRFSPSRSLSGEIKIPSYQSPLEHEEEQLIRTLQQGHGAPPYSNGNGSPREKIVPIEHSPLLPVNHNHSSRIAFAKERIRQSQENPLTQQRLELQKKLPFPNGSLAAAIALQQGKQKFQQNGGTSEDGEFHQVHHHVHGHGGRSHFVRFGPGATVADRVQLFEKYPTPPKGPGHVITHPIQILHTPSETAPSSPHLPTYDPRRHIVQNHLQSSQPLLNVPQNGGTVNPNAPWRTSPNREVSPVTMISQHPSESAMVTSPIRKAAAPVSAVPPSGNNNKRPLARVGKDVPRFFWPEGKPASLPTVQHSLSKAEEKLKSENNGISYRNFGELLVSCGIPLYWKKPFWMALYLQPDGICTAKMFLPFLRYLLTECPDDAARFARVLSSAARSFPMGYDKNLNNNNNNNNNVPVNAKYYNNHGTFCQDIKDVELGMSDFVPMMQDIIDTHPGLGFLRDAPEFHSRYITTVISRIFYKVNRSWSGRLTLTEIRRSNLLRVIKRLEEETDINLITEYFSYEHFYVIYCKFWELDKDHDLLIDKRDLAAHAEHALSSRIVDRIFSGTVLRGWDVTNSLKAPRDKMTYSDFVWFLLSEEDKKTQTAIEYWFRCLDVDGDGIISPYELQYFYSELASRIEALGIEPLHFSNVYCQIVDMLHCSPKGIRLKDLKRNPHLAANVFNTMFNLDKYLEHEQRDPFAAAALGNVDNPEGESDWDKYASAEYELLIAADSPTDHMNDSGLEEAITP